MTIDLSTVVWVASAIVTITTAVGVIVKFVHKSLDKQIKDLLKDGGTSYQKEINQQLEELRNMMKSGTEESRENDQKLQRAMMATIRDRINQSYSFYIVKGKIGSHSMYILEELYKCYKEEGGNSFIDEQMKALRALEITPDN